MKNALLLYPHQLFTKDHLPDVQSVFIVEEPLYFGVDQETPRRIHKQKLILHRASMRRYVEEVLWPEGIEVQYFDLDVFSTTGDILDKIKGFNKIYVFDPIDDVITKRLLQKRRDMNDSVTLEFLPNPNFYLKDNEIRQYFGEHHKQPFADFYQWQRERFNILIDENYKPIGKKWSFESEDSQKLPNDLTLPSFEVYGDNSFVKDAIKYVEKHFPDNPGSTDFVWPTNRDEALFWLKNFVEERLDDFGAYQNAVEGQAPWLFHSALSSSLNIGLLSPQEVVETVLKRHQEREVPLASLESFIRQILGWREYVRGLYIVKNSDMRTSNILGHQRKLTDAWYDGTLGIPPFDDVVKKINQRAYAHQIERLMIAGNLMILCEIQPDHVYGWFSELFIDAYDWVMVPNVYSMSQFADDSSAVTKPYICSSNYIMQLSSYERGEWADIWDGLFWRFIEKHRAILTKNPKMRVMVQRFDRLDADRKRIIGYRADDFLARATKQ